jgi:integrase
LSHKNEIVSDQRQKAYVGQLWIGKKRYRRVLIRFVEAEGLEPDQLNALLVERFLKLKEKLSREVERATDEQGLFFSELLDLFLAHVQANRDERTVGKYRQQLLRYQKVVGDYRIRLHTSQLTDKFVLALRKAGLNDHSCNSYLRAVRAILNWSWEQGQIRAAIKVKSVRSSKPLPAVFSTQQLEDLRQHLEEGWQETRRRRFLVLLRAWWFLRFTGMRGGELLALRWDNVYPDRIELRSTKDWKVKGRKDAIVPIAEDLKEFIQAQDIQGERYVLDNGRGKPLYSSLGDLTKSMRKALLKVGIENAKPLHSFRSTVATELLSGESSNPVQVQKLLRHQSIQTTMSYLNSDHLQQVDLVNKLGNSPQNTVSKKKTESRKPSIRLAYSRKNSGDC